jgi:tetratricopeptide (TPR) repeat protein
MWDKQQTGSARHFGFVRLRMRQDRRMNNAVPLEFQEKHPLIEVPLYSSLFLCIALNIYGQGGGLWGNALLGITMILLFIHKWRGREDLNEQIAKPNALDAAVFIIMGYETLSYYMSTYSSNSIHFIFKIIGLAATYFTARLFVGWIGNKQSILKFIAIVGGIISFSSIISFYIKASRWTHLGFHDYTNLKAITDLGAPSSVPVNEWITIYIMFIPVPLMLFAHSSNKLHERIIWGLCGLAPVYTIMLSYSRGAYLALICGVMIWIAIFIAYGLGKIQRKLGMLMAMIVLLLASLFPVRHAVTTTLSFFSTSSQNRSVQGRISSLKKSWNIVKEHPLLGVGAINYALQYPSYKWNSLDSTYSGRSYNLFCHLLVEKGIVGFGAYLFLIGVTFYYLHKICRNREMERSRREMAALLIAVLFAILVRDMTYSSVLTNHGLGFLICCALGCLGAARPPVSKSKISYIGCNGRYFATSACAVMLGALGISVYQHLRLDIANRYAQAFVDEYRLGQNAKAERAISQALSIDKSNALYASYLGLIKERAIAKPFRFELYGKIWSILTDGERTRVREGIQWYEKAIKLSPGDDFLHHNIAWLYMQDGDRIKALAAIKRAIRIDGDNAMNHLSCGLFYEFSGMETDAMSEYRNALILSPNILDSEFYSELRQRNAGMACNILKEGIQTLEWQVDLSNSPILMARLGKLLMAVDNSGKALYLIEKSLARLPQLSMAWYNMAYIHSNANNMPKAKACLERSIGLDGFGYVAQLALGEWLYINQNRASAAHYYQWGIENWNEQKSTHARRAATMYIYTHAIGDDVIPMGYLKYISPAVKAAVIEERIKQVKGI